MAGEKHPYMGSKGPIIQLFTQLRNSFPATLDATTLKKLAIGPNSEGVLLNVLRFVSIIDENGKKTASATKIFTLHDDHAFQKALSESVKVGYSELFDLHGDKAWNLDSNALITFFRQHDQTSAITGKRQAVTFEALASLCGHNEMPEPKVKSTSKSAAKTKASTADAKPQASKIIEIEKPPVVAESAAGTRGNNVGLTVRIEVNLPSDGDQETYDRIFKSIRENLLNG
ncbi:DUF5343 domain-containing protein [Flavihumibacter sp.]|uniref:DUF5343 domain-containing protein n=1 Tax=Flavihumibacter sp. TaxID=1913981 RepID=UPI002FC693D3